MDRLVISRGMSSTGQKVLSALYAAASRSFAAKAERATKGSAKDSADISRKGKTQELLHILTPRTDRAELSPEELADAAKRAKEYSRMKMKQHRAWQKTIMTKIKLRDAALAALPTEELRAAAMAIDKTPFPATRQVWVETPPLEDKDIRAKESGKEDKRRKKIGTKSMD